MTVDPQEILLSLNPAQRRAVVHRDGPLLVLAGAGTGKTRVITHRIAHLMATGCPAESILAITFTNKAAGEMKERAEKLCRLRSPWITTFHSFAARILRRHIYRLEPYDTSFTICDAEDSRALVKELLKALNVDSELWQPRAVLAEISRLKSSAEGDAESLGADFRYGQTFRRIYLGYTELMKERNLLDFDDLLLLLVRLFREHSDVLQRYREQFQYVLVDEYQDTNALQYTICRLLTLERPNLCITGDPDQSIYKWRGADIRNILDFEHDYPDAVVVKVEQNYRSTKNILHVANALIANNVDRKSKELWTENEDGEAVRVLRYCDEQEEARQVSRLIRTLMDRGTPLGDIAVFYRINSLSRVMEQELIYANIPYSIVGGVEFFLRKEVKDVLAYLRILDNHRNSESLKRIINVPPRGIGKITLERLEQYARVERCGLLQVCLDESLRTGLNSRQTRAVNEFRDIYGSLEKEKSGSMEGLVRSVVELTGYETFLEESREEEAQDRLANLGELVSAALEYDSTPRENRLRGFLELAAILGDVDRWEQRQDRVSLMTLHSAKGLEFPVVVVIGCEEGILPLLRASDAEPDIEEERRLLYVGITRAKKTLYITHVGNRLRFGRPERSFPSSFLRELQRPGEQAADAFERLKMDLATEQSLFARRSPRRRIWAEGDLDIPGASADDDCRDTGESDDEEYSQEDFSGDGFEAHEDPYPRGARLLHEEYGEGEVVGTSGFGRLRRVTVRFDEAGEKQFVISHTDFRRLK